MNYVHTLPPLPKLAGGPGVLHVTVNPAHRDDHKPVGSGLTTLRCVCTPEQLSGTGTAAPSSRLSHCLSSRRRLYPRFMGPSNRRAAGQALSVSGWLCVSIRSHLREPSFGCAIPKVYGTSRSC